MTLPPDYFDYPYRGPGLDHAWFGHREAPGLPAIAWPGGKRVALFVCVHVQHFPMDMRNTPFRPTGGMERPYPSYWDYTRRDYGNRVGIFRLMRALDQAGMRATALVQAAAMSRYPALATAIARQGWEVAAAGLDMDQLHYAGLDPAAERAMVADAVRVLREIFGPGVVGWHSPAHSQSDQTMQAVAEAGLDWVGDWVNDDMPYQVTTAAGPLTALPVAWELSDQRILFEQHQSTAEFADAVLRAFHTLDAEATVDSGRVLAVTLTPWVMGQPHRIPELVRLLHTLMAQPDVWSATASDLVRAWRSAAPA